MIHTIVTPIDGSAHAQMALDLSTDLAARYDAKLVLIHVAAADGGVPESLFDQASRALEEAESSGQASDIPTHESRRLRVLEYMGHWLLRQAQEQAESRGVKNAETVVGYGYASERIVQQAEQSAADLIIMGSRGFGKLKGFFLGSVSNKVVQLAPCSCVTVHQAEGEPALKGIGSILVPTDGSEHADKAVGLASEIASKYGAKLKLLYVTWRGPSLEDLRASADPSELSESTRDQLDPAKHPVAEHVSSAIVPPVVSKEALTEIGEHILERGRQIAVAKGVRDIELDLRDGDPARVILAVAKHEPVDMIAMGNRGLSGAEGFLAGSVSNRVNQSAPCSCLIVR